MAPCTRTAWIVAQQQSHKRLLLLGSFLCGELVVFGELVFLAW